MSRTYVLHVHAHGKTLGVVHDWRSADTLARQHQEEHSDCDGENIVTTEYLHHIDGFLGRFYLWEWYVMEGDSTPDWWAIS